MKKKLFVVLLMMLVVMNFSTRTFAEESEKTNIYGKYGVAIDANTGEILFDKSANDAGAPASMTKVLTAILLSENIGDSEKVKATPDAMKTECSCYGFQEGEEISKKDALNALMIKSANDVAVAVAEHISGSVEEFAKKMNEKAKEIGVSDKTNFVTPNGLDDENHHVTAYDMALIVREALKHPDVLEAMTTKEYTVKSNKKEEVIPRHDSIFSIPNAVGGKTGYTSRAGNTLALYFKEGEKEVITVVMASNRENHYKDSEIMAKQAFDKINVKKLYKANEKVDEVKIGDEKVSLLAKEEVNVTELKDKEIKYEVKTKVTAKKGTVKAGEEIAKAQIYDGEKLVKELPLVSNKNVVLTSTKTKADTKESNTNKIAGKQLSVWWAIGIPLILYAGYLTYYNLQKRKKIKAKN